MSMIQASPQFYGKVYGIELEIEAAGLYEVDEHYDEETDEYTAIDPIVPQGWLREQEDSIVGVELISDRPYTFEESVINIQRVFMDITRQGYMPLRTPRGSTHVHANVADLTWDQMRHFVAACAWAEPALIELAGKGRKGNLFAQSYGNYPSGMGAGNRMVPKEGVLPESRYSLHGYILLPDELSRLCRVSDGTQLSQCQ